MKLISMTIQDFGCLKNQAVTFGTETIISGRNASGKTAIKNAFFWAFGVDAGIKARPIKSNGAADYSTLPKVSVVLEKDDGEQVVLERESRADFTAQGEVKEKNIYRINDFELAKKEYSSEILNKFGLDTVALDFMCRPELFFSGTVSERRENLLDLLCIREDEFYPQEVKAGVSGHGIESDIDALKKKIRETEKQTTIIPEQLAEAKRGLPAVKEKREELENIARELERKIREKESSADNGASRRMAEAQRAVDSIEAELETLKRNHSSTVAYIQGLVNNASSLIEANSAVLLDVKRRRDEAKERYFKIRDEEYSGDPNCPTCGHPLPEALIRSYCEKFNEEKAAKMTQCIKLGKELSEQMNKLSASIEQAQEERRTNELKLEDENKSYGGATMQIAERLKVAQAEYDEAKKSYKPLSDVLDEEYKHLIDMQTSNNKKIMELNFLESRKGRIEELGALLAQTRTLYEEQLAKYRILTDLRREVGAKVEEAVNKAFTFVQWKLSEINKGGDTVDCCRALVNGIDYNNSLNSGAKILAVVDCYNVVCKRYKVPLWIDNAEQVTSPITVEEGRQIIKLYAVDKPLEIRGE